MRLLSLAPLLLVLGCAPTDNDEPFTGGNFQFETYGVTDACFDGGFELVFMPEGQTVPYAWGDPIYIPAEDELPSTYTISMPEPFSAMEVEVTGSGDSRTVAGAENHDVEINADDNPDCLVDMSIDVTLIIDGSDGVHGTGVLHTSSFDEDSCPLVDSDPCDITLDLRGVRSGA